MIFRKSSRPAVVLSLNCTGTQALEKLRPPLTRCKADFPDAREGISKQYPAPTQSLHTLAGKLSSLQFLFVALNGHPDHAAECLLSGKAEVKADIAFW